MNSTPPPGSEPPRADTHDEPAGQPTGQATASSSGPRASSEQVRDLARLRRTVGPQRRLAGVAGGIARHLDIDPLLVRVVFVITSFFGGAGVLAYLGCWLVLPEDTGRTVIATRDRTRSIIVLGLALVAGLLVLGDVFGSNDLWPLLLLLGVGGVVLLMSQQDKGSTAPGGTTGGVRYGDTDPAGPAADVDPMADQSYQGYPGYQDFQFTQADGGSYYGDQGHGSAGYGPPPAPPIDQRKRGPILFWGVLAAMVLGWGVLGLVDVTGADLPFAAYPALAIALVGAGLLLGSFWGRAGGLIALGLLMLMPLGIATAVDRLENQTTVVTPDPGVALAPTYSHSVGDYTLDLSNVDPERLSRPLRVELGAGTMTVIVPEEVTVRASAQVGLGEIDLFGYTVDQAGARVERSDQGTGDQELDLEVQLGVGDLTVVREGEQR